MEHDHSPEAIRRRLSAGPAKSYLRDFVYGGIDGAVTTFAVVSGVAGADLSSAVILILGFANLLGDGFSMAAGNYSATRAEQDELEHWRAVEQKHIKLEPGGEREEIRQIFAAKGFAGDDLERAVDVITADRDRWVRTMLTEEYGLPLEVRSPLLAAVATFAAFVICGTIPLLPFVLGFGTRAFQSSLAATAVVFLLIGSAKSRWSVVPWWRSGLETLAVGSGAAGLAYFVGWIVGDIVRS